MQAGFEFFDHTADMGLRVFAPSLAGLVPPAAVGLYSVIGELVPIGASLPFTFEWSGDEPSLLLRDFLTELLFLFERDHRIVVAPAAREFTPTRLSISGPSFAVDESKSVYYREVKAITYHELAIRSVAGGYEATIILDI